MQKINSHIIRIIMLVVALQLLNLSIYAQEFKPMALSQGTSEINISETIVEFVIENILGHKDAIPEQSQHHKDLHFHKHVSFKAITFERTDLPTDLQVKNSTLPILLHEAFNDFYLQDFDPRPPQAC